MNHIAAVTSIDLQLIASSNPQSWTIVEIVPATKSNKARQIVSASDAEKSSISCFEGKIEPLPNGLSDLAAPLPYHLAKSGVGISDAVFAEGGIVLLPKSGLTNLTKIPYLVYPVPSNLSNELAQAIDFIGACQNSELSKNILTTKSGAASLISSPNIYLQTYAVRQLAKSLGDMSLFTVFADILRDNDTEDGKGQLMTRERIKSAIVSAIRHASQTKQAILISAVIAEITPESQLSIDEILHSVIASAKSKSQLAGCLAALEITGSNPPSRLAAFDPAPYINAIQRR